MLSKRVVPWAFVRQDTFDADVARLVQVLETDIDRVHLHTRLLVRATEWETRGGDKSLLQRGAQLAEAEQWLAGQTDQKPTTTPAQGAVHRGKPPGHDTPPAQHGLRRVTVAVFQWHDATIQRNQAQSRFREATSLRLVSEAQGSWPAPARAVMREPFSNYWPPDPTVRHCCLGCQVYGWSVSNACRTVPAWCMR